MPNFKVIKHKIPIKYDNKHLLDEAESNISFVFPEQVMLGEAKLSLTLLDLSKLICCWMRSNSTSVLLH